MLPHKRKMLLYEQNTRTLINTKKKKKKKKRVSGILVKKNDRMSNFIHHPCEVKLTQLNSDSLFGTPFITLTTPIQSLKPHYLHQQFSFTHQILVISSIKYYFHPSFIIFSSKNGYSLLQLNLVLICI